MSAAFEPCCKCDGLRAAHNAQTFILAHAVNIDCIIAILVVVVISTAGTGSDAFRLNGKRNIALTLGGKLNTACSAVAGNARINRKRSAYQSDFVDVFGNAKLCARRLCGSDRRSTDDRNHKCNR